MYKLRDWIDETNLSSLGLSENPRAISYIDRKKIKIVWHTLVSNPHAMELLEKNTEIDWYVLSSIPAAIDLLQ